MQKITGLGILDVIFGVLLIFSGLVSSEIDAFSSVVDKVDLMLNKVGISGNPFQLVMDWLYLPASILLIVTGLILVGYIVILR